MEVHSYGYSPLAAAVANAGFDATGVRLTSLPISCEKVYAGLCAIPFSVTGFPSMSVPCGFSKAGTPIGMQIAAGPFQEELIFRVAHAYEQATDWHERRPTLGIEQ
jgi:Asp-tRNA(Asn)/Glu-tRNA(Gln) amidotransferase A subunit family amidase